MGIKNVGKPYNAADACRVIDYPIFVERELLWVNDGSVGLGHDMFPYAVNRNHHCIWHCLATICDASFN